MTISGTFVGAMTLLVYTAFVFTFGISAIWIFFGFCIGFIKPELAVVSMISSFLIYCLALVVSKIVKSKTAKI